MYPILFVLIFIAMIYTFVLKRCKAKNIKMRRQYNSCNRKIYWNTLLRFCLEVNLKLTH